MPKFGMTVNRENVPYFPCSRVTINLGNTHPIIVSLDGFAVFNSPLRIGDEVLIYEVENHSISIFCRVAEVQPTFIMCDLR